MPRSVLQPSFHPCLGASHLAARVSLAGGLGTGDTRPTFLGVVVLILFLRLLHAPPPHHGAGCGSGHLWSCCFVAGLVMVTVVFAVCCCFLGDSLLQRQWQLALATFAEMARPGSVDLAYACMHAICFCVYTLVTYLHTYINTYNYVCFAWCSQEICA